MHSIRHLLDAGFKSGSIETIVLAIDSLVRGSPNISRLAKDVRINRVTLYRFRNEVNPRLDTVASILRASGLRLVVESKPNRLALANSKFTSEFLTRAFDSSDTVKIVEAFAETLRAQENVSEFALNASLYRSSLYRAFTHPHVPKMRTVIEFLQALGLRLAVRSRNTRPCDPEITLRTTRASQT
jgi:DNA-binding phage protein